MTFLAVEHMWGNLWSVEEMDLAGLIARVIVSFFLFFITVAIVLAILVPGWLISRATHGMAASNDAATLPAASDVLRLSKAPQCPHCGNTRALDVRPCVKCGLDF